MLDEVDEWFLELARARTGDVDAVTAAIDMLADGGPTLGRPVVDRVKGSKRHNMKELRPSGTSIRILFIFDPARRAVLLVAGDKAGNWSGWYDTNIPVAEARYDAWLAETHDEEEE
nr:type II toxin-antitoxin system RelE/ParE family toxin [Nocardioides zeae]